jgi:hypothetical protein
MTETYTQLTIPEAIEALQAIVDANAAPVVQSTVSKAKGKRGKTIKTQTITVSGHANKCSQIIHG